MTRLALVTGTSSGLGEAVVHELLGRDWSVIGIARRASVIDDPRYTHLRLDLVDLAALTALLDETIAPRLCDPAVARLGLVNNAAVEALLGPVSRLDAEAMMDVYAINTAAPVLLMGWFARQARPGRPLRIVNVSTGAATAPFPGLAAYANTKAALRMAGMVMAAELDGADPAEAAQPATTILSYEPGVVDTPMQTKIRASPAQILPTVQVFRDFATKGKLMPPALPATGIADYLDSDGCRRWEERRFHPPG